MVIGSVTQIFRFSIGLDDEETVENVHEPVFILSSGRFIKVVDRGREESVTFEGPDPVVVDNGPVNLI